MIKYTRRCVKTCIREEAWCGRLVKGRKCDQARGKTVAGIIQSEPDMTSASLLLLSVSRPGMTCEGTQCHSPHPCAPSRDTAEMSLCHSVIGWVNVSLPTKHAPAHPLAMVYMPGRHFQTGVLDELLRTKGLILALRQGR